MEKTDWVVLLSTPASFLTGSLSGPVWANGVTAADDGTGTQVVQTAGDFAMNAAFLAAAAGEAVNMSHILQATQQEYSKLNLRLTSAEIKDW